MFLAANCPPQSQAEVPKLQPGIITDPQYSAVQAVDPFVCPSPGLLTALPAAAKTGAAHFLSLFSMLRINWS